MSPMDAAIGVHTIWDGRQRGHFEAYALMFNHPESGHAVWLQYRLLASNHPEVKSSGEVWAVFFHGTDSSKHLVLRRTLPLTEATITREEFYFGVEGCWIAAHEARGQIQSGIGQMEWNLQFFSDAPLQRIFPYDWMYRSQWPKTKYLSLLPRAQFNGLFTINDETFRCQQSPGVHSHLWGSEHARRWVWANCTHFSNCLDSDMIAYSAKTTYAGIEMPELTVVRLNYRGEEILLNSPYRWFTLHSRFEPFFWYFAGRKGSRDFVGEISVGGSNIVGLKYKDPDGRHVFCYNSKIANSKIKVYQHQQGKYLKIDEIVSHQTTGFEYAQRTPIAGIPFI